MSMRRRQGDHATGTANGSPSSWGPGAPDPNLADKIPHHEPPEQPLADDGFQNAGAASGRPLENAGFGPALRLDWAINGLWRTTPAFSACSRPAGWQIAAPSLAAGVLAGLLLALPDAAHLGLALALSVPFLCVVALRLMALCQLLMGPASAPSTQRPDQRAFIDDATALPMYSVLVPLVDEVAVLPQLIKALGALDYPPSRLDIILILEAFDQPMLDAVSAIRLPPHFRTVIVPPGGPRTKPKALNYALTFATGDLVVIYDAEDLPEPDQLRRAAAAFAGASADLVCLQCCLNIAPASRSLLSRQFAIEYSALFDGFLPALARLDLPLPLGGTSNHFRADRLRAAGAWDPFNVTEDADLGIRLARLGGRVGTLPSTTWEEAPPDFGNWLRQRTRWLKGWMLTYLVHTRAPRQLGRDLGAARHFGFHVLFGGILLSVLAYPIGLFLLGLALANGRFLAPPETDLEWWLWWATVVNFGLGFASSMLLGALAVARRSRGWLAPWALIMPLYWLLISLAGYRALWQLVREPFLWEKTRHGDGDP